MFPPVFSRWRRSLFPLLVLCLFLSLVGCTANEQTAQEKNPETPTVSPSSEEPAQPPPPSDTETVSPQEPTDKTDFSDTVLLGNSYVDCFRIYAPLPGAQCYYRVGLNVKTAFEKPMTNGNDTQTPVIELLNGKNFQHVVLFFGENELGWVARDVFVQRYHEVIETARRYCPDATIYLAGLPPVSAAVSQQGKNNLTNSAISACNAELMQLAQETSTIYIDSFSVLANADGCLPDDAASDGIHPAQAYTQKWAELIRQSIEERDKT